MTALPSIRARLSRVLLMLVFGWGLAVSAAVWLAVQHEVNELLDDTLRASAEVLVGLLAPNAELMIERASRTGGAGGASAGPGPDERFAWQLVGPGAQVLLRSAGAPQTPLLVSPALGFSDTPPWRVYGVAFGAPGGMLYVAQTRAERYEAQREVGTWAAAAAFMVGLISLAWVRTRVRRELAPLQALTRSLAGYEPLAPGATLGPAERAEFEPVHAAIHDLGRRLARRVANERAFSAHAAHALRTPLAGMDAQLAVALRECAPELQPRLQRVRAAAGRLQRVVAALLALFRSGVDLHRQNVDLAALLARLPIHGLALHVVPPASVDADPDLLAAALLNLLDNALRHGAHRVEVSVCAGAIRLQDDGPGVTPAQRQVLQDALGRQDYEGSTGLGLMLADMVARAHGGALLLLDVETGFGVEIGLAPAPAGGPVRSL